MYFSLKILKIPMGVEFASYINGVLASLTDYTASMRLISITKFNLNGKSVDEVDTFTYNSAGLTSTEHMATGTGRVIGDVKYIYTNGLLSTSTHYNSNGLLTEIDQYSHGVVSTIDTTHGHGSISIGIIGVAHLPH